MSAVQSTQAAAGENTGASVTELHVTGMTCNNCARHVTEAIQSVAGVRSASVALDTGRAKVRWATGHPADVAAAVAAIEKSGYGAKPVEVRAHDSGDKDQSGWHANLWLGVVVTLPLMLGEWVFGLVMTPWFQWLSFALTGVVQVLAGAQFYSGAWRQLRVGSSNMDTLVALGSTTAFGYSAWALLSGQGGHLYFMEAAAIITLISVGHWFEARVSVRASAALKSLLQLAPRTARRIGAPESDSARWTAHSKDAGSETVAPSPGATEIEVPVAQLIIGDLIALRPGDHVPVDGLVVEGASAVDEAMLTGESLPVDKSANSELYTGTVNLNGRLVMRVTATGESTALAHIIAAVQRAQTSRANIQRLGDRVSNVFVPLVVLFALAAGLWWGLATDSANQTHTWLGQFLWPAHPPIGVAAGFIIAAAVLIIACPCAMGLATPAAIMASANAAAARGILIRDGVALEKAGGVTAVVFDKTGTLTRGKPEVAKFLATDDEAERRSPTRRVASVAAALARHSTHPISQAIARLSSEAIQLSGWQEVRGAGVQGKVQSPESRVQGLARLGALHWLRESGVDLKAGESFIAEWSAQGATIVGFALDQSLAGLFAVRDQLKPGAAKVVGQLQREGLKTFLLTGDNALTAASIAQQVGIPSENVFAEVRPEQKADFVKQLQQRGERVAFVGDGINDAPALTQADLGIAVSRASDVAREAADIILLKSEIEAVPEALGLARATLRTIKQNLFWAFFYNAVGVPLAALGFMSPVLCAAAMGCSDLIVIGNALRLRRWRG
jgi:Cu+-exporting ATPase